MGHSQPAVDGRLQSEWRPVSYSLGSLAAGRTRDKNTGPAPIHMHALAIMVPCLAGIVFNVPIDASKRRDVGYESIQPARLCQDSGAMSGHGATGQLQSIQWNMEH